MSTWQSLSGVLEVELTSADLHGALSTISGLGLEIRSLRWEDDLNCRFRIRRNHLPVLQDLAEKRGEVLRICSRQGMIWKIYDLLKRPVLVTGMLSFLILSYWLPGRVLFVRVDGNTAVPTNQILEAAEAQGITFGASRREIRSEKAKNGILSGIPGLQWVGINTSGCVATVSVRERSVAEQNEDNFPVSRIVAARDGFIISGTVERGTGMFSPGHTVRKGQLLISGYVDGGFCIRSGRAEGEILAQTNHSIMAVIPEKYLVRMGETSVKRKISLILRKKRINLWKDSGISPVSCDRIYKEYYVTLPGGFRLPMALCVDTYTCWDTAEANIEPAEADSGLRSYVRQYLTHLMVAGTIVDSSERIARESGRMILDGTYVCREMIGREQPEQIGVTNGKSN